MKQSRLMFLCLALLDAWLRPGALFAQTDLDIPPSRGGQTYSLGMPPVYKGHAGVEGGSYRPGNDGELALAATFGVHRDLGSPVVGLGAIGLEGYVGTAGPDLDGGGRALFTIAALHLAAGVDYNAREDEWDAILRLQLPIRRGGVFGRGTQVRVNWLPGRGNTFSVGVDVPLWGRNIGRTRPRKSSVELSSPPVDRLVTDPPVKELETSVARIAEGARAIAMLSQPLVDRGGKMPVEATYAEDLALLQSHMAGAGPRFPMGRSLPAEISAFHLEIDRAFSIAAAGVELPERETTPDGIRIGEHARRILLNEVLLPYNRLLGQRKSNDSLDEFVAAGHSTFASWLLSESGLPAERFRSAYFLFQSLTEITDATRAYLRQRWEDNRFVWLPLQLALRTEDHDTQAEIDAIIERAVGQRFTDGNRLWYLMNEEFQLEMSHSVHRAEDYHVLWIHDYRGYNGRGEPDEIAFRHTVESYIEALTHRVREYDRTGKLPIYMIFLDQHYFEINKSRLFLRVLEDPMNYSLNLPDGFEAWEQELAAKQAALRQAVEASRLLGVQRRQYGEKWLRNQIRVQINVTNPSDFAFQSFHVAGIFPIPDNMMRDHRKIAFYDVTETDPYRGMAMFTGMGIGEHYAGANWEDRAVMLQGPAALAVKDAARRLLEVQGFPPNRMPHPLRRLPFPEGYERRIRREIDAFFQEWGVRPGRALQLHNETGYGPKPINVAKAILYSLMPAGSILKVPDSLWQSYIYASLLTGSALRGCKVLVFLPTLRSAPSSAGSTMARAHGLMSSLLLFQNELDDQIATTGGILRIGLYNPRTGVGDVRGRIVQARDSKWSWAEEIGRPNPASVTVLDELEQILAEAGYSDGYLVDSDSTESPKLHLKANYLISGPAWDALTGRPEWGPVLREYIKYLAQQVGPEDERLDTLDKYQPLRLAIHQLIRSVRQDRTPAADDLGFAYLTVGSANMDYRSMVMDGEAMIIMSGWNTVMGLIDFLLLPGLSTWITTQGELDELLPPPSGLNRAMANWLKLAL